MSTVGYNPKSLFSATRRCHAKKSISPGVGVFQQKKAPMWRRRQKPQYFAPDFPRL
jgi:hypothetical protein